MADLITKAEIAEAHRLERLDNLRDTFAAAALQSLIHQFEVCENQSAAAAKAAYRLADAMLQEKLNNPLK